jgi:hypothetical protein
MGMGWRQASERIGYTSGGGIKDLPKGVTSASDRINELILSEDISARLHQVTLSN